MILFYVNMTSPIFYKNSDVIMAFSLDYGVLCSTLSDQMLVLHGKMNRILNNFMAGTSHCLESVGE